MNIGGLSGTTSNTIRGFGGLASGLDRDSLIEGMTAGTMAKIEKQMRQKTLLQWEQAGIRNITDKLTAFADKYTSSYSSSTNLFSESFWGRNQITALGANGKYVSVSGSSNTADMIEIQRIKALAKKAQFTSSGNVSDHELKTGTIDLNKTYEVENLEGKTLTFKYGDKDYTVILPEGEEHDYKTVDGVVNAMNAAFKEMKVEGGKVLSDILQVSNSGDKIQFAATSQVAGNTLKLTGGSAVDYLGFDKGTDGKFTERDIAKGSVSSDNVIQRNNLITDKNFRESIAGKSLTFTYNGVSKTIKMPAKDKLDGISDADLLTNLKDHMQEELNKEFGRGRISVELNSGRFGFKTTLPGGGDDVSSVLKISSSDSGMLGKDGVFGIKSGKSNRLDLNETLAESGLMAFSGSNQQDKDWSFTVNNGTKDIQINVSKSDTVQDLMNKINKETGLEISYQSATDNFVITSKEEGASGTFRFSSANDESMLTGIFGTDILKEVKGQDAELEVKYAGSDTAVTVFRGTNTFELNGMTITLNGTFGNGEAGGSNEAIKFDAKVDEEKIVNTIKDMVKEFNEIIELVSKEMTTRPNRDYAPLTEEQKKELSESEIEAWEKKAKEGLLFNDNDIKGLSSGLRFVLGSADLHVLEKMGISVSSTATDRGKIVFDETKFKAALSSDTDSVKEMFTKVQTTDSAGNIVQTNGIATNMKNVLDKYAKTIGEPKGILITRAGSPKSPISITRNEIDKQIKEVDKKIADLKKALKMEEDRYIRQFTTLENLIAQMNSQSGMLSQFGGGF